MSHTTKEKVDGTISKDQVDSSYIEEDDNEGPPSGGKDSLKKGPWTTVEDAILIDYVSKHGEGNWNTVQKESGLSRCGKSCRLRWANHLRPNLRKGPFNPDEEKLIVELHAKMGNKWARMAAQLPGRTDNEIKNYWNTRIKRHLRAGLPLYPSDVSLQSVDENQQETSVNEFKFGDKQKNELLEPSIYNVADNILSRIMSNQEISLATSYSPMCFSNNILDQDLERNFITPGHHKRLRESETLYSSTCGTFMLPDFKQFTIENPARTHQAFGSGFPYDPDPGSHAHLNGNFSTSQSLQTTVKMELPSLQYQGIDTNVCLKDPQSSPFLLEPAYVEPSQTTVPLQSECFSEWTDGLLESVFSGRVMSNARKQSSEKSSISSIATLDHLIGSPVPDLFNLEWGPLDPISPFRCSVDSVSSDCLPPSAGATLSGSPPEYASSAFRPSVGSVSSEYLPLTSGSPPGKALPDCTSNLNVKTDPAGTLLIADMKAKVSQQDFYENDDMLDPYWCSKFADDNSSFLDPVEVITGKNFYGENQDPLCGAFRP